MPVSTYEDNKHHTCHATEKLQNQTTPHCLQQQDRPRIANNYPAYLPTYIFPIYNQRLWRLVRPAKTSAFALIFSGDVYTDS